MVHEHLSQVQKLVAGHIKLTQQKQKSCLDRGRKDVVFEKDRFALLNTQPIGLKAT